MEKTDVGFGTKGDDVLKQVGVLEEATKALKETTEDCETDKDDVASWIATIGKAILSIFKP